MFIFPFAPIIDDRTRQESITSALVALPRELLKYLYNVSLLKRIVLGESATNAEIDFALSSILSLLSFEAQTLAERQIPHPSSANIRNLMSSYGVAFRDIKAIYERYEHTAYAVDREMDRALSERKINNVIVMAAVRAAPPIFANEWRALGIADLIPPQIYYAHMYFWRYKCEKRNLMITAAEGMRLNFELAVYHQVVGVDLEPVTNDLVAELVRVAIVDGSDWVMVFDKDQDDELMGLAGFEFIKTNDNILDCGRFRNEERNLNLGVHIRTLTERGVEELEALKLTIRDPSTAIYPAWRERI